ncbi:unnamed protein product [Brassicogethes aeneus]|uniref:Uncharacterized protein n=1 Tax=Brassicogethes aeneus TaxID=1431903 RepID=A0A9P0FH98_BRAAE|nr:unnamed protein product [Brassicogethes aeneus]
MNKSFSQSLRSLTDDLTKYKFFNSGNKNGIQIKTFKSFVEEGSVKTTKNELEERIMDFIAEKKLFLEKLKNLKVHLEMENPKELDILSNVTKLEKCLEEQVIPRLKISECTVKDVLQCLIENEKLFNLYQTISLDIYNITNYLYIDKKVNFYDQNCLQFIGEHFTKMLIFFEKLKQHETEINGNAIQKNITLLYQVVNIEMKIKLRELVLKVIEEHLAYTEKCKRFLDVVIPILNNTTKYSKNKNQILGKIPEIFEEEIRIRKYLEMCSCDYNHEKMADVLTKNIYLGNLYEEQINLVRNRIIKIAFCQDYKVGSSSRLN